MHCYRISKFDPDSSTEQLQRQWTSISQVGKVRDSVVFTLNEYERVEAAYLDVVAFLLEIYNISTMRVSDVVWSTGALNAPNWVRDGAVINRTQVIALSQLELREEVSCHMAAKSGFAIDFGFDYYLYVATPDELPLDAHKRVHSLGLFIEEGVASSYFDDC